MEQLHKTLSHIKESMDRFVIGHDDIKEAIQLGLIAREHVYLEGPPGTAKTMLAEIAAKAANLEFFFYQLNRDTRLSELVGDYMIHRERDEGAELIRQEIVRGRILTADICVLDDISRAPGEALNVLFDRHYASVYNFALHMLADAGQAEDVLQESFLSVIRSADRYQARGCFRTWLLKICRNRCLNILESERARRHLLQQNGFQFLPGKRHVSVVEALSRAEQLDLVQREMARLPERQREALLLHVFENLFRACGPNYLEELFIFFIQF